MAEDRRVAVVTGANRGIGRAIAERLANEVTDPPSVMSAVAAIVERTGRLDVVVNNAGGHFDDGQRLSALTDDDLRDALEVNTIGPLRVARAALPHMRSAGRGRIVNVSSRSGSFAATWATAPAYGVSKAALNMLTLQLAKELEGSGILVNSCCPGWVRTRMGGDEAERSVEQGADTPVWLATLPDDGPTGGFFGDREHIGW